MYDATFYPAGGPGSRERERERRTPWLVPVRGHHLCMCNARSSNDATNARKAVQPCGVLIRGKWWKCTATAPSEGGREWSVGCEDTKLGPNCAAINCARKDDDEEPARATEPNRLLLLPPGSGHAKIGGALERWCGGMVMLRKMPCVNYAVHHRLDALCMCVCVSARIRFFLESPGRDAFKFGTHVEYMIAASAALSNATARSRGTCLNSPLETLNCRENVHQMFQQLQTREHNIQSLQWFVSG